MSKLISKVVVELVPSVIPPTRDMHYMVQIGLKAHPKVLKFCPRKDGPLFPVLGLVLPRVRIAAGDIIKCTCLSPYSFYVARTGKYRRRYLQLFIHQVPQERQNKLTFDVIYFNQNVLKTGGYIFIDYFMIYTYIHIYVICICFETGKQIIGKSYKIP